MTEEEMQVWMQVRETNRAWTAGANHELANLFEPEAVLVKPGEARVQGRDAIVRSYEEFVHQARTQSFEELEHSVDVFGDFAMVAYRFSIRYSMADEQHDETGNEVLALRRRDGVWRVLWRTQVGD